MKKLDQTYWNERYLASDHPWDIGYPAPALREYLKQKIPISAKILIPGAGHAHEAQWAFEHGYTNVYVCDFAQQALDNFSKRVPDFPKAQLLHKNFFELDGYFDLILEQTFFCALDPDLRVEYVHKTHELLKANGRLAGLLFNHIFPKDGPPYGGLVSQYIPLFSSNFQFIQMKPAKNSIAPRLGNEVFFELQRKG